MARDLRLLVDRAATPIGDLLVVVDEQGYLRAADWADHEARMRHLLRLQYTGRNPRIEPGAAAATAAFAAYFAGNLAAIDRLPVETGGTEFQRSVWSELRRIPCGQTLTYRALAERVARPTAVRAVGHANGSNPISVAVPCHRVVGSNGTLTGYGGGIERKRWLLKHEQVTL